MQALTAMTIGAMALGAAAFAYDSSSGQTPSTCSARQASLYFEKDAQGFNVFSDAVIERVAQEARACGARQVVAQTSMDEAHRAAIERAFAAKGLGVIVTGVAQPAASEGFIANRAAVVRVTMNSDIG